MSDDHRELRESLGAYALGSLEPEERTAVDAHLATCGSCREELAALAPLPGLLQHVDAAADHVEVPPGFSEAVMARIGAAEAATRRRLRLWQGVAVAACMALLAVLVVTAGVFEDPPSGRQLALQTVAADAEAVQGQATAYEWAWGTTVQLELNDLPDREDFRVVAVDDRANRQPMGGWTATDGNAVRWRGGSGIATPSLARVEVTDGDGRVVLTLVPDDG